MDERNWHVLGAGAIGLTFAAALRSADNTAVTLLQRSGHAINAAADVVIERGGSARSLTIPLSPNDADGAIRYLLVTTKAYDIIAAMSEIRHRLTPETDVVVLVNGMGFEESLMRDFPAASYTFGITTAGANRLARWHVVQAGSGTTRLGSSAGGPPPDWFTDWSAVIAGCQWDSNINAARWHKLAINAVINPVTALHGCRNGALAERPELIDLVQHLCDEAVQISTAAGFSATAKTLHADVARVISDTAENRSSMLQDLSAGRTTEVEFISGFLLRVAQRHAVQAPCHARLYRELKRDVT